MTQTLTGDAIGEARSKQFMAIVMKEGEIKRGILRRRMRVSEQTFAREYLDFLEEYPAIHYYPKERTFRFEP